MFKTEFLSVSPLQPSVAYLYSLRTRENVNGFLAFSGGIDKQHRAVMGYKSESGYINTKSKTFYQCQWVPGIF